MNNGGGGKGVTAAAAIAALQEAGNKTSRDMIAASYNYIAPREFHFIPLALLFHMFVLSKHSVYSS